MLSHKFIRRSLAALFGSVALLGVSLAHAEGWYGGLGFGKTKVKDFVCDLDITCGADTKDNGMKVFAGYQFNPHIAVEFGYVDLGEASASGTDSTLGVATVDFEAKGFNVAAVGSVPLGQSAALIGKAGLFRSDVDAAASSTTFGSASASESGVDMMVGLGVRFDFTKSLAFRLEWERFMDVGGDDVGGKSDIDMLSANLIIQFN